MTRDELNDVLSQHIAWLTGKGGMRANLSEANMSDANLSDANLSRADLCQANLQWANLRGADLSRADLHGANLRGANLCQANLQWANLRGADLSRADLSRAYLSRADILCSGNMREIKSMQIDTWQIAYTHDTLQIGCQRHPIEKWRKWNTDAGRRWIKQMDHKALDWAERNMNLIISIIDANPATPTKEPET